MRVLKILIADDDKDMREIIASLVNSFGWEAVTVTNGIEAMGHMNGSFDLVVTDGQMPQMGGIGLTASVRNGGHECPVIMLSGSPELMPEFYAHGGNTFIDKPNFSALRAAFVSLQKRMA